MSFTRHQILIVEDDEELAQWVSAYLNEKHFQASYCLRGDDAVALIIEGQPDLVILDGMLPGLDGLDVCKAIRPKYSKPIIMLTARDEEIDEVLGIEAGVDDYLIKPVRARALLSRIDRLIKRQAAIPVVTPPQGIIQFDRLLIDAANREVTLSGETIELSSKEFDLLLLLAAQAGRVVPRDELVSELRGFDYDGFDRTIDLQISRLRKKLEDDAGKPKRIKTVWGKGYLFVKDGW